MYQCRHSVSATSLTIQFWTGNCALQSSVPLYLSANYLYCTSNKTRSQWRLFEESIVTMYSHLQPAGLPAISLDLFLNAGEPFDLQQRIITRHVIFYLHHMISIEVSRFNTPLTPQPRLGN